ncbi:Tigger transposable element-derived protein 1 [Smittium mucronatum]|uniref:Tigger transposable element-derived protein 1 n=1 Tax=Smittium mucronatum TaxID=133383 RepID=A0A1R0GQP1_9FUNG|nr:Tigger transposable element-derived protein 1 [Smittium mucronatum]
METISHVKYLIYISRAYFGKKITTRTYVSVEKKAVPRFKLARDKITLIHGSNLSIDFRLKPMVINAF